jgi:hypothetical protein
MTVEIFAPGEKDPDGSAMRAFAQLLLAELEPVLPVNWAEYYMP